MADVFVSYSKVDKERVAKIVKALENHGWSVWWDTRLEAGEHFDEVIEREIGEANCVVVVWTTASKSSRWVKAEANEGWERGILVPLSLDNTIPPIPFKAVHSIFLDDRMLFRSAANADPVIEAVERFAGAPAVVVRHPAVKPAPEAPRVEPSAQPGTTGRQVTDPPRRQPPTSSSGSTRPEQRSRPDEAAAAESNDWEAIRHSRNASDFAAFLKRFPHGKFADQARARFGQLQEKSSDERRNWFWAIATILGFSAIAGLTIATKSRAVVSSFDFLVSLYQYVVVASLLISWLIAFNIVNAYNPTIRSVWNACSAVTEPLLRPLRRILPDLGGLDISPIVLLIILYLFRSVVLTQIAIMTI